MPKSADAAKPFMEYDALSGETVRKNMERMMSVFGDFGDLSRDGFQAASDSARATAKGMKEINERTMSYMQDAYSAGMEASRSVTSAKSAIEAFEIQAEFAKQAFETYFEQVSAMMGLAAGTMREGLEPLNAHAAQIVDKFQSAS